jgi:hypothetical protein
LCAIDDASLDVISLAAQCDRYSQAGRSRAANIYRPNALYELPSNRAAATKTTATLVPDKIMPLTKQILDDAGQSTPRIPASPAAQIKEIKQDEFEFASFGRIPSGIRFNPGGSL